MRLKSQIEWFSISSLLTCRREATEGLDEASGRCVRLFLHKNSNVPITICYVTRESTMWVQIPVDTSTPSSHDLDLAGKYRHEN